MASLRRSNRVRVSGSGLGGGAGSGAEEAEADEPIVTEIGLDGTYRSISPEVRRKRKRRASSSSPDRLQAISSSPDREATTADEQRPARNISLTNGRTTRHSAAAAAASAAADGSPDLEGQAEESPASSPQLYSQQVRSDHEESPLRMRSARKIVVKTSGRPAKLARDESPPPANGADAPQQASSTRAAAANGTRDSHIVPTSETTNGESAANAGQNGTSQERQESPAKIANTRQLTNEPSDMLATSSPSKAKIREEETPALYDLKTESDDEMEDDKSDGESDELHLGAEDRKKLSVVIQSFANDLVRLRLPQQVPISGSSETIDPRRRGAERRARAGETLDDMLSSPIVSIRKIREHLLKLQAPLVNPESLRAHLSGSHVSPSRESMEQDRRRLRSISTCLALVDEVARRAREAWVEKDERHRQLVESKALRNRGDSSIGAFALHMRLPAGDYFTNAVSVPPKEVEDLDTAHAHLVQVATAPLAPHQSRTPSLGERLQSTARRRARDEMQRRQIQLPWRSSDESYAKPVSHLYYGPWSSFGPTYDSFEGQLNYKASTALWRSKLQDTTALQEWSQGRSSIIEGKARVALEQALEELDEAEEFDIDAILDAYDNLPDAESDNATADQRDIASILARNAELLARLQELQDQRWKQLLAQSASKSHDHDVGLAEPGQKELSIAKDLLDSLTDLIGRKTSPDDTGLVPSVEKLHATASSAAIDPALLDGKAEQGSWGTLDSTLFGPTATRCIVLSHNAGHAQPMAAVRDNETLRLSGESEDKAMIQSMSSMGAPVGVSRDAGTDLLERFANTRNYELRNHPHDRKPPVPPQPISGGGHPAGPSRSQGPGQATQAPQRPHGPPPSTHQQPQQQQQKPPSRPIGRPPLHRPSNSKPSMSSADLQRLPGAPPPPFPPRKGPGRPSKAQREAMDKHQEILKRHQQMLEQQQIHQQRMQSATVSYARPPTPQMRHPSMGSPYGNRPPSMGAMSPNGIRPALGPGASSSPRPQ